MISENNKVIIGRKGEGYFLAKGISSDTLSIYI